MHPPLRHYEGSSIKIDLLDIVKEFIKAYDTGRTEYSISYRIDFDTYFNDYHDLRSSPLFIENGMVIDRNTQIEYREDLECMLDEDTPGVTARGIVRADCEEFTCKKYEEIIHRRISEGLESLGLRVLFVSESGGATRISFDLKGGDVEKYRDSLREIIDARIAQYKGFYDASALKRGVLDATHAIGNTTGEYSILCDRSMFPSHLFEYGAVNSSRLPSDCIDVCVVDTSSDLFGLILFALFIDGDIFEFRPYSPMEWAVELNPKTVRMPASQGIQDVWFDESSGIVTILGNEYRIKIGNMEGKLFALLYRNRDRALSFQEILSGLEVGRVEKTPGDYCSALKGKLPEEVKGVIRSSGGGYIIYSKQPKGEKGEI